MAYKLTIEEERILKECNQNAQKRAFIGGCLGFYLSHFGIVALKKAFPNLVKAWKEPLQSRFPALTDKLFASNYSSTPFKISGILFRILCSVFGTYSGFISSQNVCIQRILALNTVDEPNRSHLALDLQKYMNQKNAKLSGFMYELDELGLSTDSPHFQSPESSLQGLTLSKKYTDHYYESDEIPEWEQPFQETR
eukprot:Sdes_comp13161_c0_seq1m3075